MWYEVEGMKAVKELSITDERWLSFTNKSVIVYDKEVGKELTVEEDDWA